MPGDNRVTFHADISQNMKPDMSHMNESIETCQTSFPEN